MADNKPIFSEIVKDGGVVRIYTIHSPDGQVSQREFSIDATMPLPELYTTVASNVSDLGTVRPEAILPEDSVLSFRALADGPVVEAVLDATFLTAASIMSSAIRFGGTIVVTPDTSRDGKRKVVHVRTTQEVLDHARERAEVHIEAIKNGVEVHS